MSTLASVALKAALSMFGKLVTAEALEWLVVWAAEKLAAHTDTPYDDELVAKVKELLSRS